MIDSFRWWRVLLPLGLLGFACSCPSQQNKNAVTAPKVGAENLKIAHNDPPNPAVTDDTAEAAILDSLRTELKRIHKLEMVFAEKHVTVKGQWAWVHVRPQSPDGANRYEDVLALMHFDAGKWKVAEIPCTEEDNPQCLDDPGYLAKLKQRFPELPAQILDVIRPKQTSPSTEKTPGHAASPPGHIASPPEHAASPPEHAASPPEHAASPPEHAASPPGHTAGPQADVLVHQMKKSNQGKSSGMRGTLSFKGKPIPQRFTAVVSGTKVYEYISNRLLFRPRGYFPVQDPQAAKKLMFHNSDQRCDMRALKVGLYLDEARRAETPKGWIFVRWEGGAAFVDPARIDKLVEVIEANLTKTRKK